MSSDRRSTHYFIKSQPLDKDNRLRTILDLPGDSTWVEFCHLMWSYRDYTPDNRGHHVLLKFSYVLPETEANKFSAAVEQDPDLLEEVFQGMYPGLVDRGLQRVQTDKVCFITLPTNKIMGIYDDGIDFMQQVEGLPKKAYSRVIGEQPNIV